MRIFSLFIAFTLLFHSKSFAQTITTYAGNGTAAYVGDGGQATASSINYPFGVTADTHGNLFFADAANYVIRKIDNAGIITTIAGTGAPGYSGDGGLATAATFADPEGLALDSLGNIYVTDLENATIRKINTSGIITTIAGTGTSGYNGDGIPATSALLNMPRCILIKNGEILFSDPGNYRIRKISTSGVISTIAGTGLPGSTGDGAQATAAKLATQLSLAADKLGNFYIYQDSIFKIRKVAPNGIITSIAGTGVNVSSGDNGLATAAGIGNAGGMTVDVFNNLYFSDENHGRIRKIDHATNIVTTIVGDGTPCGFSGDGGPATNAQLCGPYDICIDKNGVLFFADQNNQRIRRVRLGLGVENTANEAAQITLSPNPATAGAFTLNISTGIPENAQITITNVTGSTVSALQGETNKAMEIQLNVPKGLYFVTVTTSHGVWVEKVVVD